MAEIEKPKKTAEPKEQEHDYLADAPKERPYSEAVTDEQREHLKQYGIIIPDAKAKKD
jgi:hypothetical protein